MHPRLLIALALVAAVSLILSPALTVAALPPAQEGAPNLLQDGDFEWSVPWESQDGNGPIQPAPAWRAWWVPTPPPGIKKPYNCTGSDYGCYWAQPEFGAALRIAYPYRVHGGNQAQKYFTYGRMGQAGIWQKVGGIQPGTRLRFSVYMQSWMCFNFADCDYGKVSDKPAEMHLKIGIDPTGGDKPSGPDVVWSGEQAAWDTWVLFQVEAVARSDTVTVFTHSRADWDWARTNNDVYVDDASLVAIGQAPPATAAPPTKAPATLSTVQRSVAARAPSATATPAPTLTPIPTFTATPTSTPTPTETPARRVLALPLLDTSTPASSENGVAGILGLGGPSSGGFMGLIFLAAALFLGAGLAGMLLAGRRPSSAGEVQSLAPIRSQPPAPGPQISAPALHRKTPRRRRSRH